MVGEESDQVWGVDNSTIIHWAGNTKYHFVIVLDTSDAKIYSFILYYCILYAIYGIVYCILYLKIGNSS